MKKILLILSAFALLLVSSCVKDNEDKVPFMKGTFYTASFADVDTVVTVPQVTKSIDIRVLADTLKGTVASDNVTITLGVDPDYVEEFNKANGTNYVMAPTGSYEFTNSKVSLFRYNVVSTTGSIKVGATYDMDMNTVYMIPIVIASVSGTEEYEVSNDKMGYILLGRAYSPIAMGAGTPDNPYVIRSAEEFGKIRETLIEGSKVYYKLAVDVDMSSFGDWEGLNGESPYTRAVDFDGDGHTLSNLTCRSTGTGNGGLFSVLNGEVRNLNIVNAKIGNADNKNSAGIIATFGGYHNNNVDFRGSAINCHVQGTITTTAYGNGGIFGYGYGVTIERCSADVEIKGNHHCAGIVGYLPENGGNTVKNCYSTGTINGTRFPAGIIGYVVKGGNTTVSCCYSTMTLVSSNFGGAAMIGRIDNATESDYDVVENCIAWNDRIECTRTTNGDGNYSLGAVVGDCTGALGKIYLTNCFRNPNMEFVASAPLNVLCDQPNFDPSNPPSGAGTSDGASGGHIYPYHGVAAAAGTTCSQVAKSLGWDENIWDLSGDLPKLK